MQQNGFLNINKGKWMNCLKFFETQIQNCVLCDGEYLKEETVEEYVTKFPHTNLDKLNNKINNWKNHKGDKCLFYLLIKNDGNIDMKSCWLSEIETELNGCEYVDSHKSFPRFRVLK
jgi:hypothetical protein